MRMQAMALVADGTGFWGTHPHSNRWGELAIEHAGELGDVDGEAVLYAVRHGWLTYSQSIEPGYVMPNDTDGGVMDCHWRFEPVPAWATILGARLEREDFRPIGASA